MGGERAKRSEHGQRGGLGRGRALTKPRRAGPVQVARSLAAPHRSPSHTHRHLSSEVDERRQISPRDVTRQQGWDPCSCRDTQTERAVVFVGGRCSFLHTKRMRFLPPTKNAALHRLSTEDRASGAINSTERMMLSCTKKKRVRFDFLQFFFFFCFFSVRIGSEERRRLQQTL